MPCQTLSETTPTIVIVVRESTREYGMFIGMHHIDGNNLSTQNSVVNYVLCMAHKGMKQMDYDCHTSDYPSIIFITTHHLGV